MREIIKQEYEVKFKNNISSINSVSLDVNHELDNLNIKGTFILSGDYKPTGLSLGLNDFKYDIPFNYKVSDKCIDSSINIEINDFTYEIDADTLNVFIEYTISYEEDHEEELKKLDEIFDEVIDFREDVKETVEVPVEKLERETDLINVENEDEYITYHVCIVSEDDTLESIINRYNTNIEIIKEYNEFDELKTGMKLIIPYLNE